MAQARAECADCGETWEGDFETVAEDVEGHDQFHDVQIQRVATDGGTTDLPDTLYYNGGNAGASRRLHVTGDPRECRCIALIDNVQACTASRPPRGQLCQECASDLTLADLVDRRAATDGGETISDDTPSDEMERLTVRVPDALLTAVDTAVDTGLYPNRSEAVRDALRQRFMATDGGENPEALLSRAADQVRVYRINHAQTEGEHTVLVGIETRIRGVTEMLHQWREDITEEL